MNPKLRRILEEFSKEYYDPTDPIARRQYEEEQRSQLISLGIVTDNQDPDKLGRVRVHLPMVAKEYISDWAWVIRSFAGSDKGSWNIPDIGDQVMVIFRFGNIHRPMVFASMYNWKKRPPIADNPDNNIKAVKTKGTYLLLDDTPDAYPSSKRSARPGPGEEKLEASIKDGQIRVVIDTDGVHLTNEPGCMAEQWSKAE